MFNNIKALSAYTLLVALLVLTGCSGSDDAGGPNQTTGPGDTMPPTLLSLTPENGTARVPTNTPVVATFSENIDPTPISSTNFFVLGITGSVSVSGAVATFTPDDYLVPLMMYHRSDEPWNLPCR